MELREEKCHTQFIVASTIDLTLIRFALKVETKLLMAFKLLKGMLRASRSDFKYIGFSKND